MPALRVFIKKLISISILLLCASTVMAAESRTIQEDYYLKQFEKAQKEQIAIEIKENGLIMQAVSEIVASEEDSSAKTLLSKGVDARHKAIVLSAEGNYVEALDKITKSTDLIVMAINKIEDGMVKIENHELQRTIEERLPKVLARLKDKMTFLLTQHEVFQATAAKAAQKRRDEEMVSLTEEGKKLKEKAIAAMIDIADYEGFKEYIKKSTNNFIRVVTLAAKEGQDERLIFEKVMVVIHANRSIINAASSSLASTDNEEILDLFKKAISLRKSALVLYSQGDYEKAMEDLKKSNDFAIKVIRFSVEDV